MALGPLLGFAGVVASGVFYAGTKAVKKVTSLKWQEVLEGLPALLGTGILAMFTGPVGKTLWKAAFKVWLFAFVYAFMTQWVIYRLWPIMVNGLKILPVSAQEAVHNGFVRGYQVVIATQHFIPWEHGWTVCKWLIIIKFWLIAFHLCDWVFQKTREVLNFLFG